MAEDDPPATGRNLHWCPIYHRDLSVSTADWTDEEFGAYMRLLFHQWERGKIPIDPDRIARISSTAMKHWHLIGPKFPGGINPRMAKERADRDAVSDRRSEAARKANAVRWASESESDRSPNRIAGQSQSQSQKTETEQTPPSPPSGGVRARPKRIGSGLIEPIYDAYPRKVGKLEALEAIKAAIIRSTPEGGTIENAAATIAERVRAFAAKCKRDSTKTRFIPHPATWFNRGSYDDEDLQPKTSKPAAATSNGTGYRIRTMGQDRKWTVQPTVYTTQLEADSAAWKVKSDTGALAVSVVPS